MLLRSGILSVNLTTVQFKIKRGMDIVFSVILLLLLAAPLVLIAILIKRDGGPILFVAERAGFRKKGFPVFKFRSMRVDADKFLDEKGRPTGKRITAIGAFIRRFSIDELGQLFNILRGEMSFIGPRPILPDDAAKIEEAYDKRFEVLPGISGLAQVSGRNNLPWKKRFEIDVEYVEKYSLALDLKIFIKTFWVVVSGSGLVMDRNPDQVRNQNDSTPA